MNENPEERFHKAKTKYTAAKELYEEQIKIFRVAQQEYIEELDEIRTFCEVDNARLKKVNEEMMVNIRKIRGLGESEEIGFNAEKAENEESLNQSKIIEIVNKLVPMKADSGKNQDSENVIGFSKK